MTIVGDEACALGEVHAWLLKQPNFGERCARAVRNAFDEVIDGGRTGRRAVAELEKTEKTYLGTKVEILFRNEFQLARGRVLDYAICGHEVDMKCTVGRAWTIPMEVNVLATLDTAVWQRISSLPSGQDRVNELFRQVQGRIVSRNAIETVARQLDAMKRMRDARLELLEEGILVLGHQGSEPEEARRRGLPVPRKGQALAVRI